MIQLSDILDLHSPTAYKLHLGSAADGIHPLDEFVAGRENWLGWNESRGAKDDWSRPYILSFIEYYPRGSTWLFGGTFEVKSRLPDRYILGEVADHEKFVGRLLVSFKRTRGMRGRHSYLERHLPRMLVSELLPEPYTGESFPGHARICHSFSALEAIIHRQRSDWKAALENMKGVYLLTDGANGKHYVGSAYGDRGLWARWSTYVETGHGGNHELVRLVKQRGLDYVRSNFQVSLIEAMVASTPDSVIIAREQHWKRALQTVRHGYNKT